MDYIHRCSELLYQNLMPNHIINPDYYYMFHDPTGYLTPIMLGSEDCFIHFLFKDTLPNISQTIESAFRDYPGSFDVIPIR